MSLLAVTLLVTAAACRVERRPDAPPPPNPSRPDILSQFWLIPGSHVLDTTGSPEAQRKQLRVAMPIDTVRVVFRERMRADGWTLVSDVGDANQVAMHARKDSSLVWLTMDRDGPMTTLYTVIAARVQPADTARPAIPNVPARRRF